MAPEVGAGNRKERKHKVPLRAKTLGRRKARFGNAVKSPEQKPVRVRRTRSSTFSSQYATTSDGSNPGSRNAVIKTARPPRHAQLKAAVVALGTERTTPITRRLRPRPRGSETSSGSTEVDADQEDNGDDETASPASSRQLRQSDSVSTSEVRDRRAKREALRAMQNDDMSSDDSYGHPGRKSASSSRGGGLSDMRTLMPSASSPSAAVQRKASLRTRSGSRSGALAQTRKNSSTAVQLGDHIDIDLPPLNGNVDSTSSRTRSGKAFGDIQERSESSNDLDEDDDEESRWGPGE